MPNITGRIRNDAGAPQPELSAEAWVYDVIKGLKRLDVVTTAADGSFTLNVSVVTNLFIAGVLFDLHVRIRNSIGRLLWMSEFRTTTLIGDDWPLNDITIPRTTLSGWLVTNLDPAGGHQHLSQDNLVSVLIDNDVAWQELKLAVTASKKEINILILYLAIENLLLTFDPGHPKNGERTKGSRLEELILTANRSSPPVAVRFVPRRAVIDLPIARQFEPSVFYSSAKLVKAYYEEKHQPNTVQVLPYDCSFRLPMHAKLLTFDGVEAHIMGSPFDQQYFDADTHAFDNPRRGRGGNIRVPIHDVGVRLQGPSALHVEDTVSLHWVDAGGPAIPPKMPVPAPTPNASVQIVRTLPGDRFFTNRRPAGEVGILEAYQRCFEQAQDFIYLENQYFVEKLILTAIRAALKRSSSLQIIININSSVDMKPYNSFQRGRVPELERERIPQFLDLLADEGNDKRLGIFCLWTHEAATPKSRIIRNYIHAKVALADDAWATVGTANLDGVSLVQSEHFVRSPRKPEADFMRRATEVNALIFNNIDGQPNSTVPIDLRKRLWAEHLGSDADVTTRPGGGWLALWRQKAEEKLQSLRNNAAPVASKILPWNVKTKPRAFLEAHNIDPTKFDVRDHVRDYDFDQGKFVD
jgi:phosphatidylserine/phosphatidylglycerophosphate/cardiolipin synthase-like enzyme